jgi:mono/diheme cytochrome c family protein
MKCIFRIGLAWIAAVAVLAGCGGEREEPAAQAPPAAQATAPGGAASAAVPATETADAAHEQAENIFETRCVSCHGEQGEGNGPASAGLQPPPRNFKDPAWQASVTDDHIEQIIQYGGAAVGRSLAMPANPDLTSKPEVVAALREHVRDLAAD